MNSFCITLICVSSVLIGVISACGISGAGGGECDSYKPKDGECRRKGVYYAIGGSVCLSEADSDPATCEISKTELADNAGCDKEVKGARKIDYTDNANRYLKMMANAEKKPECEDLKDIPAGMPKEDFELYKSCIQGIPGAEPKSEDEGRCVKYFINLNIDGPHEASLKISHFPGDADRAFSVKFHNTDIVKNLRPSALKAEGGWIDLSWNFEVADEGRKLIIPGYPDSTYGESSFEAKICYGTCMDVEQEFKYHAFSVVRFGQAAQPNANEGGAEGLNKYPDHIFGVLK